MQIEDLAPFIMVVSIVAIVFSYLSLKLFVNRKFPNKPIRKKGRDPEFDGKSLDEIIQRASELKQRVQVLEEIIESEKEKD